MAGSPGWVPTPAMTTPLVDAGEELRDDPAERPAVFDDKRDTRRRSRWAGVEVTLVTAARFPPPVNASIWLPPHPTPVTEKSTATRPWPSRNWSAYSAPGEPLGGKELGPQSALDLPPGSGRLAAPAGCSAPGRDQRDVRGALDTDILASHVRRQGGIATTAGTSGLLGVACVQPR